MWHSWLLLDRARIRPWKTPASCVFLSSSPCSVSRPGAMWRCSFSCQVVDPVSPAANLGWPGDLPWLLGWGRRDKGPVRILGLRSNHDQCGPSGRRGELGAGHQGGYLGQGPSTPWASVSSSTKWRDQAKIMLKSLLDLYHFTLMKTNYTYVLCKAILAQRDYWVKLLPSIAKAKSILYVEQRMERCSHRLSNPWSPKWS